MANLSPLAQLLAATRFEKHAVVVSRHWNNPKIDITVNRDGITLICPLDDFVRALVAELGSARFVLLRREAQEAVARAAGVAVEKIKESSARVM